MLSWILAGLILGWLALAVYPVRIVLVSIKQDRAELSRIHREESDAMLADKLAHSFQIVLVQSRRNRQLPHRRQRRISRHDRAGFRYY